MTLLHISQRKHAFWSKTKEKSKPQKQIPKNKVSLELLHQRLGHRSTRSLLDGDTKIFWQDIDLRVYNDPFCPSYQIYAIKKGYIKDTYEIQDIFKMGVHGNHTIHIFQKFNKVN